MRFQGRLKAMTFKNERVSVLLEDARKFDEPTQTWEDFTDEKLMKSGDYKKGSVWMSAFEGSAPAVYQACEELKKMGTGIEVEVNVVENKGFFNIAGIGLKMPEKDVNADLSAEEAHEKDWQEARNKHDVQPELEEPSSEQRPSDSPEAQAERMSDALDNVEASREVLIIRQTCIKAVGSMVSMSLTKREDIVAIAKRLEKYVLGGK